MDVSSEEGNPLLLVHETLDEAYSERIAAMEFMLFVKSVKMVNLYSVRNLS